MESEDLTAEATAAPMLSIGDLVSVIDIIDLCVERGAFEGSEIAEIGQIRNRYALFINHQLPDELKRDLDEILIPDDEEDDESAE